MIGSFGLFFTLFLLFCRFLPVIAIGEIKGVCVKHARDRMRRPPTRRPDPRPTEDAV